MPPQEDVTVERVVRERKPLGVADQLAAIVQRGDYYTRRDPARTTRRLVTQLELLGHAVTLAEGAAG